MRNLLLGVAVALVVHGCITIDAEVPPVSVDKVSMDTAASSFVQEVYGQKGSIDEVASSFVKDVYGR